LLEKAIIPVELTEQARNEGLAALRKALPQIGFHR
jgi:hypothetical protein